MKITDTSKVPENHLIRILHFNDCYNVEEYTEEPKGGAARFKKALELNHIKNTIVLFSGDILGPSILSTFTFGEHMANVLNQMNVQCAVFGNHEFDYGLEKLNKFVEKSNFDWLMSNVIDRSTDQLLGNGKLWKLMQVGNIKIGIIGLVEKEWVATLATLEMDQLDFCDPVEKARQLCTMLRKEHAVHYVIALTHMRMPNDERLAKSNTGINLILGGHDHVYDCREVEGVQVIKSGSDFRELSVIDLFSNPLTKNCSDPSVFCVNVRRVKVNSYDFDEDENLKLEVQSLRTGLDSRLNQVLGELDHELDGRFSHVRTQECVLGNFVADTIRTRLKADIMIINSGTFRSDRIHPKGNFLLRDLFQILPMLNHMVVLRVTGNTVLKCLENAVSQYPKFEGRFAQVSGLTFSFDPEQPPGSRVITESVKIGGEPLKLSKHYKMVTKMFLHLGKDGYECLKDSEVLLNEDDCPRLTVVMQNFFEDLAKSKRNNVDSHKWPVIKIPAHIEGRINKVSRSKSFITSFKEQPNWFTMQRLLKMLSKVRK